MVAPTVGMELQGFRERNYELKERLGGGSFASAWRAEVSDTHTPVAIKIFQIGGALVDMGDVEQAWGREVQVLIDIRDAQCPHLVRLHESFKDEGSGLCCIVMNLVAGSSLQDRMCTPYTLTDVRRWTRQLATALACLASLKPDPVVHGDVKPDNLFVETASGDLLLGDFGVAMWHRLRAGLRPAQWLLSENAFIAPERRLSILGPTSGLSEEEKERTVDELLKKVGGEKLDMWSLGVMTYLLGLRKAPHGYDDPTHEAKVAEVEEVAERVDAMEWLQAELHNAWPHADAGEVRQLAAVIAGTLHGHGGRLSASDVLELLPTTANTQGAEQKAAAKLRAEYKQQLAQKLKSRPGMLHDCRLSLSAEDVVPLDLLPNTDFLKALTRNGAEKERSESKPVVLSQLLSGEVCAKGLNVIIGPAGAGKTTLLHHLALRLAESDSSEGDMPVIVHAQNLLEKLKSEAKDMGSLMQEVAAAVDGALMTTDYSETLQCIAVQAHSNGKPTLTLLVDGLDEVVRSRRHQLLQHLLRVQASSDSPFRRVLVSSRPGAFESMAIDHKCLEAVLRVMPLDKNRSERLVQRLMAQWSIEEPTLVQQVSQLARTTFQGSPLLLYLLCCLAKKQRSVPTSPVELFERILDLCLQRAEAKAEPLGQALQWDDDTLKELCGLTAFLVHRLGWEGRSEVVERKTLEDALSQIMKSEAGRPWAVDRFGQGFVLKRVIAEALEGFSGLLCQQGSTGYRMLHRNLEEYLAARFLARRITDPLLDKLRQYVCLWHGDEAVGWCFAWSDEKAITSDWWDEVYRFAGLLRGPTWLAEGMLHLPPEGRQYDQYDAPDNRLAGCPASARQWLQSISERGIDKDDVFLRRLRHVLRACCGGSSLPNAIDAESAALTGQAIAQIVAHNPRLAYAIILDDTFLSSQEWSALPTEIVDPLCEYLLKCVNASNGRDERAMYASPSIGPAASSREGAVEALVRPMSHEDSLLPISALAALSKMRQTAASREGVVEVLVGLLSHARSHLVKTAAFVLGEMREAAAIRPDVVQALVGLLGHADSRVGLSAASALGKMGDTAASRPDVVALVGLLNHADSWVASSAAGVLREMGETAAGREGVVGALVGLLSHADSDLVKSAASALGKMGHAAASRPDVVDALLRLLGHADSRVVMSAADALVTMGKAEASRTDVVDALTGLLSHADTNLVSSAAYALGKMGHAAASRPDVVDALLRLLGHVDSSVVMSAADALVTMGKAEASRTDVVDALTGLLSHVDTKLVKSAAYALGKMGHAAASRPDVVDALLRLLGHVDSSVVMSAAYALGQMGEAAASRPDVLRELVGLLSHADISVVDSAADVLGKMGEAAASRPDVVDALSRLLGHADSRVARLAACVLGQMGEAAASRTDVLRELVGLLSHADISVVDSAAYALGEMGEAAASRPGVVDALLRLLGHADSSVVMSAADALVTMGKAEASRTDVVDALTGLLSHVDTNLVSSAAYALGKMGHAAASRPDVVDALLRLLSHADSDLVRLAAGVLGQMGEAAASRTDVVDALVGLLSHADSDLVKSAAYALGKMGEAAASRPGVVDALMKLLNHADSWLASSAVSALGQMGDAAASREDVVNALVGLLSHADSRVASVAADALTLDKVVAIRPALVESLLESLLGAGPSEGVPIRVLSRLGPAQALVRLERSIG